jgi:hypothetical protein
VAGPNVTNFANKVVFLNGNALTLPISATNPVSPNPGDIYFNTVSNMILYYNGSAWLSVSGGSSSLVNNFTLSVTDISNKFVTLTHAPTSATSTILTVIDGPMQSYGADFIVSGSQLSWSGLFLDGVLVDGDTLVIQFN